MKPSKSSLRQSGIPDHYRIPPDLIRAFAGLQHEHKKERMVEAFRALVEMRRRYAGFAGRLEVMVYVPQCEHCYSETRRRFRADDSTWRPPDILPNTWRRDLRVYGATERDLRRIYRIRQDSSIDSQVHCRTCQGEIRYGEENVYVNVVPFEDYFPELVTSEDRDPPKTPPKYVKTLVYLVYKGKCAGCGKRVRCDNSTMDHIRPRHVGGPGTLENIQLACKGCNSSKGKSEPEVVDLWLDFPLIPPGPEFPEDKRLATL